MPTQPAPAPSTSFKLQQAKTLPEEHLVPLYFGFAMDRFGVSESGDPLINQVCGLTLDFGRLFAYCFRRFGYPAHAWDGDKELVSYLLATSHPALFLNVRPNPAPQSCMSLEFLVQLSTLEAVQSYAEQARHAWAERMWAWAEQAGLPEWLGEWQALLEGELRARHSEIPLPLRWQDALNIYIPLGAEGSALYTASIRAIEFRQHLHAQFAKVERWPALYRRPVSIALWNADDPLKPVAEAAVAALQDLARPVSLRDRELRAYDPPAAAPRLRKVKPAASSGFAGAMVPPSPAA